MLTDRKLFGNAENGKAIREAGFASLDRDRKQAVIANMAHAMRDRETLQAVASAVPREHLHALMGAKVHPKDVDHSAVSQRLSVARHGPASKSVSQFVDAAAHSIRHDLLPGTWLAEDGAILGGNPPEDAPPPPPLKKYTSVNKSYAVPLVGGVDARDHSKIYIDYRCPDFLWIPEPAHWEDVTAEIIEHEGEENKTPTNIDEKGYDRAHKEDGNAGTREKLEESGTDPIVYSNVFKPIAAAILEACEKAKTLNTPPHLDPRVYTDSGLEHLLKKRSNAMPLQKGPESISPNMTELKSGPHHAKIAEKHGEKKAHQVDVAIAMKQAKKPKRHPMAYGRT